MAEVLATQSLQPPYQNPRKMNRVIGLQT